MYLSYSLKSIDIRIYFKNFIICKENRFHAFHRYNSEKYPYLFPQSPLLAFFLILAPQISCTLCWPPFAVRSCPSQHIPRQPVNLMFATTSQWFQHSNT